MKQIFSKDTLPKDYGGEGPSLEDLNGNLVGLKSKSILTLLF
jgi:hypothetical protein